MTAEITRIGKWTSKVALEEALKHVNDEDPIVVVAISRTDQNMRYWTANANNMEVNWMADNMKHDVLEDRL